MQPIPGQHIKIFFRNGLVEEGVVVSWSEEQSVLKSLYGNDKLIIQKTSEDIQAIKVFYYEACENKKQVYIDEELKLDAPERDPAIRALKLADLRILRGREERERVRHAMRTFNLHDSIKEACDSEKYGQPNFGKSNRIRQPPRFYPSSEGTRHYPGNHR